MGPTPTTGGGWNLASGEGYGGGREEVEEKVELILYSSCKVALEQLQPDVKLHDPKRSSLKLHRGGSTPAMATVARAPLKPC